MWVATADLPQGVGTARSLPGRAASLFRALVRRSRDLWPPSGTFLDAPGTALVADAIFTARQERPLIVGDLRLQAARARGCVS